MRDDFMPGNSPAIDSLKAFYLARLEAACFTVDFFYSSGLVWMSYQFMVQSFWNDFTFPLFE